MADNGKRASLQAAKGARNDEFYTLWADIEREMNAYLEYDPDVLMALIEIPQSCSSEFLRSRGQVSAGSCRS